MWFLVFIIGIATDLVLFGLFLYLQREGFELDHIRTLMFLGLALDSLFFAYSLRSLRRPIWQISLTTNPFFLFALLVSIGLLVSAYLFESLRNVLSIEPLTGKEFLIILSLGILDIILIELGKWLVMRRGEVE